MTWAGWPGSIPGSNNFRLRHHYVQNKVSCLTDTAVLILGHNRRQVKSTVRMLRTHRALGASPVSKYVQSDNFTLHTADREMFQIRSASPEWLRILYYVIRSVTWVDFEKTGEVWVWYRRRQVPKASQPWKPTPTSLPPWEPPISKPVSSLHG